MLQKLTLALAAMFAFTQVNAQQEVDRPERPPHFIGHEVVVSHGLLPSNQIFASFLSPVDYTNHVATGSLGVTYRYHFSRVISMGMAVVYEHENGTWRTHQGLLFSSIFGNGTQFYGNFHRNCLTVAPEITFNYGDVADGMVRIYGMIGLGFTMKQQQADVVGTNDPTGMPIGYAAIPDMRRTHMNMQLTPFGMRFGRALGGFFEVGCGYKGVFCYGATYRF